MVKVGKIRMYDKDCKFIVEEYIKLDNDGDYSVVGEFKANDIPELLEIIKKEGYKPVIVGMAERVGYLYVEGDTEEHETSGFESRGYFQVYEYEDNIYTIDEDCYAWKSDSINDLVTRLTKHSIDIDYYQHDIAKRIGIVQMTKSNYRDYLKDGMYYLYEHDEDRYSIIDDENDTFGSRSTIRGFISNIEENEECGKVYITDKSIEEFLNSRNTPIVKSIKQESPIVTELFGFGEVISDMVASVPKEEITKPLERLIERKSATNTALIKNTGDDLKMNTKTNETTNITNMLGLQNGVIENSNVQLDMEGNLCVKGRYVRQDGMSADIGAENKGFLKLLATTVSIDTLKVGDLILDEVKGNPVFVKSVDNIKNGEVAIQCFIENDQMARSPQKNPITGKATIVKLQNIFSLIGIENLTKLAPLMGYGEDVVMNLVIQQIVKTGSVDVESLEMELNPSLANIRLTQTIERLVSNMGGQAQTMDIEILKKIEERLTLLENKTIETV